MNKQYVVVIEYPDDGPSVIGPFLSPEAAQRWLKEEAMLRDDEDAFLESASVAYIMQPN